MCGTRLSVQDVIDTVVPVTQRRRRNIHCISSYHCLLKPAWAIQMRINNGPSFPVVILLVFGQARCRKEIYNHNMCLSICSTLPVSLKTYLEVDTRHLGRYRTISWHLVACVCTLPGTSILCRILLSRRPVGHFSREPRADAATYNYSTCTTTTTSKTPLWLTRHAPGLSLVGGHLPGTATGHTVSVARSGGV